MTLDEALKRNPYDPKRGNKSAYCRYLRYNVTGWYELDSKEVLRRWDEKDFERSIITRTGILDDNFWRKFVLEHPLYDDWRNKK